MEHRSFSTDIVVPNDDYSCGNKRARELAPDVAPEELRKEKQVGGPVNCSDSELCTFLRALEEGFLPTYYSDTNQFVQLKSMSIASRSYQRGKKTVVFHGFPSLQMSRNLTESHGEDLLTWYLEGFPAKTFQSQGEAKGSREIDQACGSTWRESLENAGQLSLSLKTPQTCEPEVLMLYYKTLPRSGTMRSGAVYQQQSLGLSMSATGCGSLLPTPTCHNAKEGAYPAEYKRNTPTLATHAGGKINPEWTEWLMGWPIGWTDLKPLGMDRFQSWRQQHLNY